MVACCLIGDEVNRLISAMNSLAFKTFVLKIFGRMHAQLYVMFDGFGGKVFGLGKNMLVLTTIGRRTGQARSTALLQWQDGESICSRLLPGERQSAVLVLEPQRESDRADSDRWN